MSQHLPRYHNNTMINFLAGVTVSTGRVAGAGAELWVAPAHMVQRSTITPATCFTLHLSPITCVTCVTCPGGVDPDHPPDEAGPRR